MNIHPEEPHRHGLMHAIIFTGQIVITGAEANFATSRCVPDRDGGKSRRHTPTPQQVVQDLEIDGATFDNPHAHVC